MKIEEKNLGRFVETGCPFRNILDRFGDKWSLLVIYTLSKNEKLRFSELNKEIDGISQKMLTVTLRTLEADGLIDRKIYAQVPPKVEYKLTKLGTSLVPMIIDLANWAELNQEEILNSRAKFAVN